MPCIFSRICHLYALRKTQKVMIANMPATGAQPVAPKLREAAPQSTRATITAQRVAATTIFANDPRLDRDKPNGRRPSAARAGAASVFDVSSPGDVAATARPGSSLAEELAFTSSYVVVTEWFRVPELRGGTGLVMVHPSGLVRIL